MANQKCAVIISGFPGVGKTSLHGLSHDGSRISPHGKYTIYDVEAMAGDPTDEQYWRTADALAQEPGAVVLVTASGDSHRRLLSRGRRFVCVRPGADLRDEYMRRYFDRYYDRFGMSESWESMYRYWEQKIGELGVGSDELCTDWELEAGEDLEDVLPYILAGVEDGAF